MCTVFRSLVKSIRTHMFDYLMRTNRELICIHKIETILLWSVRIGSTLAEEYQQGISVLVK